MTLLIKSIAGSRFRVAEFDFTRNGDLLPELLVVFLVYMAADSNRRGVKLLLADFWLSGTFRVGATITPLIATQP